jgi:cytochrome c oxidase subunit 2
MSKLFASIAAGAAFFTTTAWADQPHPWQWRFQEAVTPIMEQIEWFEVYTLWFIVPITLFVLALLAYCIWRFRESVNPTPSRTSHNTVIEIVWTVAPVVVLLMIAIPSFQLLTHQYTPDEEPKLTLKATGNQWNWDYEYQIEEPLSFNSALLADGDRAGLARPISPDIRACLPSTMRWSCRSTPRPAFW